MSLLGRILLLGVSGLICLALAEVMAQSLLTSSDRHYIWPPGLVRDQEMLPELVLDRTGPSRFTINTLGMRGDLPTESHRYRILAVGGSTTIGAALDDAETWPYRVQGILNATLGQEAVWVGNVGRPGHGTWQHADQIDKMIDQDPAIDAVLILVGANDMLVPLSLRFGSEYGGGEVAAAVQDLGSTFSIVPWQSDAPFYQLPGLRELFSRSVARTRQSADEMDDRGQMFVTRREIRSKAGPYREEIPEIDQSALAYRVRLEGLVELVRARGKRIVFVTQPSLWRDDLTPDEEALLWTGGPLGERGEFFSAAALARGMDRYNQALLDLCEQRDIDCIDAAHALPKNRSIHLDDVHFTVHGAEKLAQLVADALVKDGVVGRGAR